VKELKVCIISLTISGLLACSGSSYDDDGSLSNSTQNSGNTDNNSSEIIDITDANFTTRVASCASYAGYYSSNVMDIQNSKSFVGDVSVLAGSNTCTIQANTIPNHDFNDSSAHFHDDVAENATTFSIPVNPQMASSNTTLSLGTAEAVLLNGVTLDVLPAACYDVGNEPLGSERIGCGGDQQNHPWRYDPMSPHNNFGTDAHNAHTQPGGKYHYHANPIAMFEQDCSNVTTESPVIGFAADGFPVYGSCINDNGTFREVVSSYRLKQGIRQELTGYLTPTAGNGDINSNSYDGQFRGDYEYVEGLGDLDECNGRTVDGQYGYYITNSFPWVLNCFKGQVDNSFSGADIEEYRAHGHTH